VKTFFKWTVIGAIASVGGTLLFRGVQRGRSKVKSALRQAEAVADRTRAALEETESALRSTREAI
jgi:hypothetical protein